MSFGNEDSMPSEETSLSPPTRKKGVKFQNSPSYLIKKVQISRKSAKPFQKHIEIQKLSKLNVPVILYNDRKFMLTGRSETDL